MPKACFVKNCRSVWTPVTFLSFHQFPMKNEILMNEWMAYKDYFRSTPTKNSTLCSNHFSIDCFVQCSNKRLLKRNSVPTMFCNNPQCHDNDAKKQLLLEMEKESIDIEESKIDASIENFGDSLSLMEVDNVMEKQMKTLRKKLKTLQGCSTRQQRQLNRMRRILHKYIYQRSRKYK